jgi:hypothetical protein
MRIGVDFDNTIAGYDALFATLASERGLLPEPPQSKRLLRDALRRRDGGESDWRRLQSAAYGARMAEAELIDGADRFLRACRTAGAEVFIVSHKTRYANFESDGTDLRRAALRWLNARRFFDEGGFGLCPDQVFFEDTRQAKAARIEALDCNVFVDDLEELFREPGYPEAARKILFDPDGMAETDASVTRCRHWDEIRDAVFG